MILKYINDLKSEFNEYSLQKMKQDILAGLTTTAVALPLALAFGVGCGASASAGLITAIISGLIIGALSGASFQISGPTGAMTAILILLSQKYGLEGIWIAGAMSGIILIIAGVLRLGKLVSYIPSPVVTGFTSGIAIIIAIGQLDNFFGIISNKPLSTIARFMEYFKYGISPNWYSVLLGSIVIITMIVWPIKWNKIIPSSLMGLILSLSTNMILKLPVSVIGEIPKTLLPEARLNILSITPTNFHDLIIPAFSIATLCMIESLLCGEVGAKMKGEKLDANRELVSQGIGNIIIPFFGGVPATAAIARTSIAIKSGCQTRFVSLFHSIGLLFSMFILAPIMCNIPVSSLAGVLIVTSWRMNEWENIKYIFSKHFNSGIYKYIITVLATVIFDLTQAIIIGIIFASIIFMVKISQIEISVHHIDEHKLLKKLGINIKHPMEDVRIVYLTGPLFFATVKKLETHLSNINDIHILILSMRGVPLIDTSGIQAIDELYYRLKSKNSKLMLCGLQPKVLTMLKKSNLASETGDGIFFWDANQALLAVNDMAIA